MSLTYFPVVDHTIMMNFIESVLCRFESCFSRKAAFRWFITITIGLMLRSDKLGVTSVIRDLALSPDCYDSMIHFFRSCAWSLENIRERWFSIVKESFPIYKEGKFCVLIGDVVFHSLRHSSTTYKLKLNKGDLKATQGDTGHAQIDMITEIYAHILDEDRKINAQKFETAFYSNPDMRPVERNLQGEGNSSVPKPDAMMKQLESAPQLMDAFTQKFIEQYGEQIMTQLAKKMLGT